MKKTNHILIFFLSYLSFNLYTQDHDDFSYHNSINSSSRFIQEFTQYVQKHTLSLALISTGIYLHQNIIETMKKHPYISSICLYFILHYCCDSIVSYQQQEELLNTMLLIKKLTLYLVISHGIKNYLMQQMSEEQVFDANIFFNNITEQLPYSFNEITLIALKAYPELKSSLQQLNSSIYIASEEFIFLCHPSSITMQSILYLVQNNPVLYQSIYHFEQNPQTHLTSLEALIKSEITEIFFNLEEHLLTSNIHNSILP